MSAADDSGTVHAAYVRRCPGCGTANPPAQLRCSCGLLLAGVDLSPATSTASPATTPEQHSTPPSAGPAMTEASTPMGAAPTRLCPHDDCGQENPAEASRCLYCDRPFTADPAAPPTLLSLPAALAANWRIVGALPAKGAEAELLVVAPLGGGEEAIAKIYRHGIRPKREVRARIAAIDPAHCVRLLDSGRSDGFSWELMEYCRAGSLRTWLDTNTPNTSIPATQLPALIRELATALAAVHAARLLHRDLKPENVLVRSDDPLDLVLTDFGIASLHDATVRFTGNARTLAYGAPETLSGVIDEKADWWSLGMIVLEAASGRHPFVGLSDAVILHRLATRPVDLAPITDPRLRTLLAGLLARNPKLRWGGSEVLRWLDGDRTLSAPQDSAPERPACTPYRLAGAECYTPAQLAAALARNWAAGTADLDNGLLLGWFRDTLRDHDLVRTLLEINSERAQHVDVRLLRLLIHLAPGMPPVWRGESIGLDNILAHASRALQGEEAALDWLDALYQHRVLDFHAAAGNAEAADLVERWHLAFSRFASAWSEALQHLRTARDASDASQRVVLFDDVVFGQHAGLPPPPPRTLHARLLALTYDEAWGQRLRARLAQVVAHLLPDCPWLPLIADPANAEPAALLVLHALLPEARRSARSAAAAAEQARQAALEEGRQLCAESAETLALLREAADFNWPGQGAIDRLRLALDGFFTLCARVRGRIANTGQDEQLRRQLARIEPIAIRLGQRADALELTLLRNRGWLSRETLGASAIVAIVLPLLLDNAALPWVIGGLLGGLYSWCLLLPWSQAREIGKLARQLDRAMTLR